MSDFVLLTATRTRIRLHALADYARQASERVAGEERGADVIEYVGMLIFAAIIVVAILGAASGLASQIVGKISSEVSSILGH